MSRVITSQYTQTYRFDAALDSLVIGTTPLRGPKLPSGAIVTDALLSIDTGMVGAGGSGALTIQTAADVQAVALFSNAQWNTVATKRASVLTATAAPIKCSADRQPSLVISGGAVTAGVFRLVLYVVEIV